MPKGGKSFKKKPTIIKSSDESDSNKKKTTSVETDVEEIEKPKETPEEELGKIIIIV